MASVQNLLRLMRQLLQGAFRLPCTVTEHEQIYALIEQADPWMQVMCH